jgi:hypothetical protein
MNNIWIIIMNELSRHQFIHKKIVYLKDRVLENPLLQRILDEYENLQEEKKAHTKESIRRLIDHLHPHEVKERQKLLEIE